MSLVEDGNALSHIVDGRLQQVAIVLDGRGGIVEQLERRRAAVEWRSSSRAITSRDEAGPMALANRCSAKRSSADIGLGIGSTAEAALAAYSCEGALSPLRPEIASHRIAAGRRR